MWTSEPKKKGLWGEITIFSLNKVFKMMITNANDTIVINDTPFGFVFISPSLRLANQLSRGVYKLFFSSSLISSTITAIVVWCRETIKIFSFFVCVEKAKYTPTQVYVLGWSINYANEIDLNAWLFFWTHSILYVHGRLLLPFFFSGNF